MLEPEKGLVRGHSYTRPTCHAGPAWPESDRALAFVPLAWYWNGSGYASLPGLKWGLGMARSTLHVLMAHQAHCAQVCPTRIVFYFCFFLLNLFLIKIASLNLSFKNMIYVKYWNKIIFIPFLLDWLCQCWVGLTGLTICIRATRSNCGVPSPTGLACKPGHDLEWASSRHDSVSYVSGRA
jgi:hypothetical protein